MRKGSERMVSDERILGGGGFVQRILALADEKTRREFPQAEMAQRREAAVERIFREGGIRMEDLRRGILPKMRLLLMMEWVAGLGLPLAEVARPLGDSTSAVSERLAGERTKST